MSGRTFTARELWVENNRMAGEVAKARTELDEANAALERLRRENERLIKELAGKREAMARVLDGYRVHAASPGRTVITGPNALMEVQANGLGDVVRAALHHAKGGAQ